MSRVARYKELEEQAAQKYIIVSQSPFCGYEERQAAHRKWQAAARRLQQARLGRRYVDCGISPDGSYYTTEMLIKDGVKTEVSRRVGGKADSELIKQFAKG